MHHFIQLVAAAAPPAAPATGIGVQGITDLLAKGLIPLVMTFVALKAFYAAKDGNTKKAFQYIGAFAAASLLFAFALKPTEVIGIAQAAISLVHH
jgi:predicted membrane-bound spermidine synthase